MRYFPAIVSSILRSGLLVLLLVAWSSCATTKGEYKISQSRDNGLDQARHPDLLGFLISVTPIEEKKTLRVRAIYIGRNNKTMAISTDSMKAEFLNGKTETAPGGWKASDFARELNQAEEKEIPAGTNYTFQNRPGFEPNMVEYIALIPNHRAPVAITVPRVSFADGSTINQKFKFEFQ